MGRVRFVLNRAGIDELLVSEGMHTLIAAEVEGVRARAEAHGVLVERGGERHPMPYETDVRVIGDRVSGIVVAAHPAGLAAEAKYGTLVASL